MFKIIAVTNRSLCTEDFLARVEQIAAAGLSHTQSKPSKPPKKITSPQQLLEWKGHFRAPSYLDRYGISELILREKDLSENEYLSLAKQVTARCDLYGVKCTLHSFPGVAEQIGCTRLHLPFPAFQEFMKNHTSHNPFSVIGTSVHSVEEAQTAAELGADYLIAGHIFETDCKQGLPGRGLAFLKEVCQSVPVPVYAIGGIDETNIASVRDAGASGACLMSPFMLDRDPDSLLNRLRNALSED